MADPTPLPFLELCRQKIRLKHYSLRTEQAYLDWIKRFILFHGKRHPAELGAPEVEAFLTHLAVDRGVSASTQNQAKSALLFMYKEVLGAQLPWLDHVERAKTPTRLPVVLTQDEVAAVLKRLDGVHRLIGRLLYGTGMRIMEGMRLRVKDVEFTRREILVRDGKGQKDRVVMLPDRVADPCNSIWPTRARCTSWSWRPAGARSTCRMRWAASIPVRGANGAGSMCFRRRRCRAIRAAGWCGATI